MPDSISANSDSNPVIPDPDAKPWFQPMVDGINRIANFSERQREAKAPGLLDLSPAGSAGVIPVISTHVKMRVHNIIITSAAVAVITLIVGGSATGGGNRYRFNVAIGTTNLDFPIEIDRGVDVTVVQAGDLTTWTCFLFYYPE